MRRLLAAHPDFEVVRECSDGASAITALREIDIDVVFLDVQMPAPDGFDVLKEVPANRIPVVIFVTAPAQCSMPGLGPYDLWAIEYGYSLEDDLKPILARAGEPELQYSTDEETFGPDPLARRYDLGADPIQHARGQMTVIAKVRHGLVEKHVRSGESWAKARRAYEATLALQLRTLNLVTDWLGEVYLHRDRKGDGSGHEPHEVVPASTQREVLLFVIENALNDQTFGLDRELLTHLAAELWLDQGESTWLAGYDYRVEERVLGVQAAVLTRLLAPARLRRVAENESRVPIETDAVTLPELLDTLEAGIWSEIVSPPAAKTTARRPLITGLRRNLQREHLERLIDLARAQGSTPANRTATGFRLVRTCRCEELLTGATQTGAKGTLCWS